MKTPSAVSWLAWLAVALLVGGCESPRATRIREHPVEFAALDPFNQKLVREGLVNSGFSATAVYMALGKPDRVAVADSPEGGLETWVYKNFLYESMRSASVSPRETASGRPSRDGAPTRIANQGVPGASTAPLQPTVAEMSGPPLATLLLDVRDGRVISVRIEF